jgi:hypothetical protein
LDVKLFAGLFLFCIRIYCSEAPSPFHTHFMHWKRRGFFVACWRSGLAEYDEMEGIAWNWQSIDGAMVKALLAQETVGRNPTD